ncbi:MAG: hypothetical protein QXQ79_01745, partial [Candidatus Nanoarchaeia archaeon]
MKNKILFVIFSLLLFITLGEIIYFLLLTDININTSAKKTVQEKVAVWGGNYEQKLNWSDPKQIDFNYRVFNPNLAIDAKVLHTLWGYKKQILKSSTIKNVHEGRIVFLDNKGGKAFYDYYNYLVKIKIAYFNDPNLQHTFFFSEDDLQKTKFFKLKDKKEMPIDMKELKVGDIVKIEEEIDALKSIPLPVI